MEGPAIIDELDSTVVLYPGYTATAARNGSLNIEHADKSYTVSA